MKITNKKSLGVQKVFDIGCEENHNFLVSIGENANVFAHNCFNASHSVAYSYISWITAYLKANYPADFMSAVLTCDSSDLDEVKVAISSARDIGVNVIHPEINSSAADFKRIDDTTIRFGLSAIKGLGEDIIRHIILERSKNGDFKDFPDLVKRVQLNKRATDGLIYSGALDCFSPNRHQMIMDSDLLLDWGRDLVKNKNSGQMSLFDLSGSVSLPPPKSSPVADFSLEERSQQESEYLGICLGKKYDLDAEIISGFCDRDIEYVRQLENDQNTVLVAKISEIRSTKIKNGAQTGKSMCFMLLSDNSGEIEAVMFPNAYESYHEKLRLDKSFLINGVVSEKNGEKQIIVNNICAPSDVELIVAYIDDDQKDRLTVKTAISFSRGEMPLLLWYRGHQIRTSKWLSEDAIENLNNLGISAIKTPCYEIQKHFDIFECVDMLRNAEDWQSITELSLCFSMKGQDYGKTVWQYAPPSVRNHVNLVKKSALSSQSVAV